MESGGGKELSDQTVLESSSSAAAVVEEDQEIEQCESGSACGSTTSMEDVESPKSVVAAAAVEGVNRGKVRFSNTGMSSRSWRTTRKVRYGGDYLHIQVLRVKEEDSHLGKDLGEGFSAKIAAGGDEVMTGVGGGFEEEGILAVSKKGENMASPMMLPASPLGFRRRTAKPKRSEVCN